MVVIEPVDLYRQTYSERSSPATAGTPTPGHIDVALQLFNTPPTNAGIVRVVITPMQLTVLYLHTNPAQIGNLAVNGADWTAFSWIAQGSTSIVTNPAFALSSSAGIPNTTGYVFSLTNNGAGTPSILQQPTAANGFTLIVRMSGQAAYDFRVSWTASTGQPLNFGNLENFGGTDIPIEHPTLETTQ